MENNEKKWPDNAPGLYFVNEQCIDCDACRTEAPHNFTRNNDHGYSFVFKQPQSPDEHDACHAALEACPVEAIQKES